MHYTEQCLIEDFLSKSGLLLVLLGNRQIRMAPTTATGPTDLATVRDK